MIVISVGALTVVGATSANALSCPSKFVRITRGTVRIAGLLLERLILAPSSGEPEANVTVMRTPILLPPTTVEGESVTEEIGIFCDGAATVKGAVFVTPP